MSSFGCDAIAKNNSKSITLNEKVSYTGYRTFWGYYWFTNSYLSKYILTCFKRGSLKIATGTYGWLLKSSIKFFMIYSLVGRSK